MIVVKLMGGLGNQMFQYALGKSLAMRYPKALFFDDSFFNKHNDFADIPKRELQLNHFNFDWEVIDSDTLRKFYHPNPFQKHILNKIKKFSKTVYIENGLQFHNDVLNVGSATVFDGYWQNERYFSEFEELIRQDFIFKTLPNYASLEIKADIVKKDNSVSVHVRRGDYISSDKINALYGTCSLDYFYKAMNMMEVKLKDPHFYFFSDDTDWVEKNLQINYPRSTIISHNKGIDSWQDMMLMSSCENHVISNSSFSWWGAWLNPRLDKIIIAPYKWFNDEGLNTQSQYIVPKSWIRI